MEITDGSEVVQIRSVPLFFAGVSSAFRVRRLPRPSIMPEFSFTGLIRLSKPLIFTDFRPELTLMTQVAVTPLELTAVTTAVPPFGPAVTTPSPER